MDAFDDAALQLVALLARKYFDPDDAAFFAVLHAEAAVFYVAGLVAEDAAQETLFMRELRLVFGCKLAHQNDAGAHLGAGADNAVLVEVAEFGFRNVGDVVRGLLGPELGVQHIKATSAF